MANVVETVFIKWTKQKKILKSITWKAQLKLFELFVCFYSRLYTFTQIHKIQNPTCHLVISQLTIQVNKNHTRKVSEILVISQNFMNPFFVVVDVDVEMTMLLIYLFFYFICCKVLSCTNIKECHSTFWYDKMFHCKRM